MKIPASLLAAGPPKGRYGRSSSLKWPWLYDKLRAKGYSKSKAAAISNSRLVTRKKGRLNVLHADQAHNPKVLAKVRKTEGKHLTGKQLVAAALPIGSRSHEFACHSKACAPPPVGAGGSTGGPAPTGVVTHSGVRFHPTTGKPILVGIYDFRGGTAKDHPIITAAEARGDSRPVSHAEFQRLAKIGQGQLDAMKKDKDGTDGLDRNWDRVKADSHTEVMKPWGGATINAKTGEALPQGANAYAITVKDKGASTVSVREGASKEEFDQAMDLARERFGPILERKDHYLGVFHDDDNKRIDIDPVIVVTKREDVDTIGAASHAVGGAYNFSDGNGYWPPHVAE